jgi:hypothetical protein
VEHRRRRVAERTFAWISKHRRCVRDYETKPDHHEAMIYIVMIMNMSRRLARTGDWGPEFPDAHSVGEFGEAVVGEQGAGEVSEGLEVFGVAA